ncbi:FtsW/RodA/SpoVE family cell cycle protein [Oenococcus sp. UCMA 16435]|nr:FtsW/RodA/SpoVE family cell cycle protein [Oenococcus sp. UCMA 16435]MDI4584825.1 FtsW/RodA/SpoVE family cell cycle protein [Oenococcus sp. UCMA 14587]MDN6967602.1 FtsW/RodA/SpoVE family cell cycle protein [Oenococcus sp. UCMA 17063]
MSKILKQLDWFIIGPFLFLSLIGVLMVFSSSADYSEGAFSFLIRQSIFAVIGVATVLIFYFFVKINWLASPKWTSLAMLITFGLLLFARFIAPATAGTGAHGWINLPMFNIQPAEIFKIVIILYLASLSSHRLDKYQRKSKKLRSGSSVNQKTVEKVQTIFGYTRFQVIFVLLNLMIVILMPDLGNALIALFLIAVIIFSSGLNPKYLFFSIALILIIYIFLPAIIKQIPESFLSSHYQARRLLIFLDPWPYAKNQSLQLVNSFYAIAHGGLFGVGLGNSIEKMGYLPEANTDFIMAVFVEELGSVTLFIVLGILLLMIGRMFYIAFHIRNNFGRLVLYGIASYFFIQALVNLGGIIGVLPLTGVTFPFISYGGSSFLISSISVGIACVVSRTYSEQINGRKRRQKPRMRVQK